MEKKVERRGLGRGLSSLMADVNVEAHRGVSFVPKRPDTVLPIEVIFPNPNQPRREFDEAALDELADSIRKKGVIQPLIVRVRAEDGKYEIVAGERRWRAAQMAQLHELPVIVRDFTDAEVLEIAIIENIQRADLNAIDEALAYQQLITRFGHTQEMIAEALSRSRSHIANLLRLLHLPDAVQAMVSVGTLSAGHARALITSANALELAQKVVSKGLSVRETEALVRKPLNANANRTLLTAGGNRKDADTAALEADLSANLGMGVNISHETGAEKGRLTVSYNTLDQLDLLCRALSSVRPDRQL
jgi:ParB family chromosome partitioning protein